MKPYLQAMTDQRNAAQTLVIRKLGHRKAMPMRCRASDEHTIQIHSTFIASRLTLSRKPLRLRRGARAGRRDGRAGRRGRLPSRSRGTHPSGPRHAGPSVRAQRRPMWFQSPDRIGRGVKAQVLRARPSAAVELRATHLPSKGRRGCGRQRPAWREQAPRGHTTRASLLGKEPRDHWPPFSDTTPH
eukprot:3278169-Prymnesium_polylepis.2